MAKTAADLPVLSMLKPGKARLAVDDEPEQAEEGEAEVIAEPRLGKDALGYLAPRKGIDAPGDFRQCQSCQSFIPERAFHAATTGNRCKLLGGNFPIGPGDYCHKYTPWPQGKPVEHAIEAHALMALNNSPASVSPWEVGYCANDDHKHQCGRCRFFDAIGDPDSPGPECEFFEELNSELPNVFQASTIVEPNAGCNAWSEPAPDEPDAVS